jgi:hypothetical protein
MKQNTEIQRPDYYFLQERTLHILSLHEEGLLIERLVRGVAQTMPPEFGKHIKELRGYVRQILYDLKSRGEVDLNGNRVCLPEEEVASLHAAVTRGKTDLLKSLLEGESVSNEEKNEALISAVINNQTKAVKMLLEAGAAVNAKDRLFGRTVMIYVTKRTREEITQLLIDFGA